MTCLTITDTRYEKFHVFKLNTSWKFISEVVVVEGWTWPFQPMLQFQWQG